MADRAPKSRRKVEFGDFQTPATLAAEVVDALVRSGTKPQTIVEPTCGVGAFVEAAIDRFARARVLGFEVNRAHLHELERRLDGKSGRRSADLVQADFFTVDWRHLLARLPEPILLLGNPPWVTSAALGRIGSGNLPAKSNIQGLGGLDALTGKSNFDISEWMITRLIDAMAGREAMLAMLCKRAVARKVLLQAWTRDLPIRDASIHAIDAERHFGASVDACLFVVHSSREAGEKDCRLHDGIDLGEAPLALGGSGVIGFREGQLVADLERYSRWRHLAGVERLRWRSGVKHDCAAVMELREDEHGHRNGLGESVDLEPEYLYPMLKGSEVANPRGRTPDRWMLVPQRRVGDATEPIREASPRTWAYLERHGERLDRRASTIYRGRPRFSIFGVGDYSFAEWKVAISGLYKSLDFRVVGPRCGKPTLLDDTVYFLACRTQEEAAYLASLLDSQPAREFYEAFVFWDAKRPVTIGLLAKLDLLALARELGSEAQLRRITDAG